MAKIIIAWEYEHDSLRILRLKQLQQSLAQAGHDVVLVGATLSGDISVDDLPFMAAPRVRVAHIHKPRELVKMGGYGDRLAMMGFAHAETLATLTKAWDHLLSLIRPDMLITDCAPGANLAAYNRYPTIQFSDGFGLPPSQLTDFPRLRPDAAPIAPTHVMLANVQAVQKQRHEAAPEYLPQLLAAPHSFVAQLSLFDPYANYRKDTHHFAGSYRALPDCQLNNAQQRYVACLDTSYPDVESIIIALSGMPLKGTYYIPGAPASLCEFLRAADQTIVLTLPCYAELFNDCSFVVHHGNSIMAECAFTAGIPQYTLPAQFENEWICNQLAALHVSETIVPQLHPLMETAEILTRATQQSQLREWAVLHAQQLEHHKNNYVQPALLECCERLM